MITRLPLARLATYGLAGALIFAVAACTAETSLFKQSAGAILFPEILPDTVPVSPSLSSMGAIYGHVVDPNGLALPGARVTNGSAVALTGDGQFVFPTREIAATDNPIPVLGTRCDSDASPCPQTSLGGGTGVVLATGDFVLDGLPLGANTLTVSFDEAKVTVPVFVGISSFSSAVRFD
ncbi:MAG: hypothetical protein KGR26_01615, partial [Cyanobacteria bacterium REEB65]|nr:hypothetical protein [Cyanobacteria bacterium REEB65]